MKIHIDLDVTPEEIPLVTELIELLGKLNLTDVTKLNEKIAAVGSAGQGAPSLAPSAGSAAGASLLMPPIQPHNGVAQPAVPAVAPQAQFHSVSGLEITPLSAQENVMLPSLQSKPILHGMSASEGASLFMSHDPAADALKVKRPNSPLAQNMQAPSSVMTDEMFRDTIRKQLLIIGAEKLDAELHEDTWSQQQKMAVTEMCRLLNSYTRARPDAVVNEFFAVFSEIVFDPQRVTNGLSVVPLIEVLLFLPDTIKFKVRDKLIQKVLKQLTAKRPIDCNRLDFFACAEAFAALVKIEFVNINGAVSTIRTLLAKPESRCAAVTMLGKTVELCLNLLNEKCDPLKLNELHVALRSVTEDVFRYDVDYIEQNMFWGAEEPVSTGPSLLGDASVIAPQSSIGMALNTNAQPFEMPGLGSGGMSSFGAMPAVQRTGELVSVGHYTAHSDKIFTLAYDTKHDRLVSTGKDGLVISWDQDGHNTEEISLPMHYACSMDINSNSGSMFLCCVPKQRAAQPQPKLMHYVYDENAENGKNWVYMGSLGSDIATGKQRVVSCVEALSLGGGNQFATGETINNDAGGYVRLYDAESASFDRLQPVVSYKEHPDFITSLTTHPTSEHVLFSGSRDGSIRMWDKRQPKSVATLNVASSSGNISSMITCIHASGQLLAVGAMDSYVRLWDIRALTTPAYCTAVDKTTVLKVAINERSTLSYPILAVSTNQKGGLYLSFPAAKTTVAAEGADSFFYDLVWDDRDGQGKSTLYAAGDDLSKFIFNWA